MYCFFNKFFFKVEIFGNLPIFCHAHLVAIQDFVDREILFDRCGKCPMLCLFFDFKWTISAVKSTAHVMPCFMRQHSAFLCGGLAFAAINDKEIVKERDCEIVFEFNIHNVYVQSFQIIIHTANGCVHAEVLEQQKQTQKKLEEHIQVDDERNANLLRTKILRFNDELIDDKHHTREHFIEILAVIDAYEDYCRSHPDYKNNRCICAVANIKRVYNERLQKHDFS